METLQDNKTVHEHDENNAVFSYNGELGCKIPRDVTRVLIEASVQEIIHSFRGCNVLLCVHIPKTVKIICDGAFAECLSLQEVILTAGLKEIGCSAFEDCESLVTIDLPHGLATMGEHAFTGCKALKTISIPTSVETIEEGTFSFCTSLEHVNLHSGIKGIGRCAFANCESLQAVEIPHGITIVNECTFGGCWSLRKVSFPSTMINIGPRAFLGCTSLVDVQFPDGLKCIDKEAFAHCSLTTVALPSSLEEIRSKAFWECSRLLGVEIPTDIKDVKVHERCFADCASLVTVSIPADDSGNDIAMNLFSGRVLFKDAVVQNDCRNRFSKFPIHKLCYNSSRTTVEEMNNALGDSSNLEVTMKDTFGMTPFHIVATSPNPRVDIVQCLFNKYRLTIVQHQDKYGKTMLDYLLLQGSSKLDPVIRFVLQRAIGDQVSGWCPVWKEKLKLSDYIESIQSNADIKARNKQVLGLFEYTGACVRKEMTSLLELSLWKTRLNAVQKSDSARFRESCRWQCGSDVVVGKVTEFLFVGESKISTALSTYPLCSFSIFQE